MIDLGDGLLLGQPVDHLLRVLAVAFDPERQRLQPLDELEGVERRQGGAKVAQQGDPGFDDVGDRPQGLYRLGPYRAVIAGVGLVEAGEALGVAFPVDIATIDVDDADRGAVASDILGMGMYAVGRAVLISEHRWVGYIYGSSVSFSL